MKIIFSPKMWRPGTRDEACFSCDHCGTPLELNEFLYNNTARAKPVDDLAVACAAFVLYINNGNYTIFGGVQRRRLLGVLCNCSDINKIQPDERDSLDRARTVRTLFRRLQADVAYIAENS